MTSKAAPWVFILVLLGIRSLTSDLRFSLLGLLILTLAAARDTDIIAKFSSRVSVCVDHAELLNCVDHAELLILYHHALLSLRSTISNCVCMILRGLIVITFVGVCSSCASRLSLQMLYFHFILLRVMLHKECYLAICQICFMLTGYETHLDWKVIAGCLEGAWTWQNKKTEEVSPLPLQPVLYSHILKTSINYQCTSLAPQPVLCLHVLYWQRIVSVIMQQVRAHLLLVIHFWMNLTIDTWACLSNLEVSM